MTRINVVPVQELCDQHLLAEYRELPRVFRLAKPCDQLPKNYVLGTGHVKFFFNKLAFLTQRHKAIVAELTKRGFHIQYPEAPVCRFTALYGDYTPTPLALFVNRQRIAARMPKQPRFNKEYIHGQA